MAEKEKETVITYQMFSTLHETNPCAAACKFASSRDVISMTTHTEAGYFKLTTIVTVFYRKEV